MSKKLLAAVIGVLYFCAAQAASITVTSNADSGPGTLREAISLAAANGTAVQDIITFNLATDIPSRTFNLLSELPPLSSNLIIDASAQPGIAFGISNTKIILSYSLPVFPASSPTFNCMNAENARDIEIYGIYFRSYSTINGYSGVAIYCNNTTNIQIGAPGKGNLFTGWLTGVGHPEGFAQPFIGSTNVFIQSNIFGLLEDGNTTTYGIDAANLFDACCKFGISLKESRNVKIGGATAAEGNLINFSVCAISLTGPTVNMANDFFIIENNSIGCNPSKTICTTSPNPNYECIHAEGITGINITGNYIMGKDRYAGINMVSCADFSIKGNAINVDINGNQCASMMNEGIILQGCYKGIIGGSLPLDRNVIAFTNNLAGIYTPFSTQITISRNSTYCNNDRGSILVGANYPDPLLIPFVTVQSATANTVSGKALPGSVVELFIDDDCPLCEGKLYVTTVIADQNGNWTYSGSNTDRMVATATDINGSTSEFSIAKINITITPLVKPATCGLNNGSITNVQILSGTNWHWEDEAGNIAGNDTTLHNAAPGKYRLIIEVGSHYCSYKTNYFEITQVLLPATVSPVVGAATCGLNNGNISFNYNNADYTAKWLNASMDSVGTGSLLDKILPGDYYLKLSLTVDTNCQQLYGPFKINNQSGPSININSMQITPATCSKSNGSITGITANNVTGVAFIQWRDSTNKPVGNAYDLINAASGKYRFVFKDASSCDTIITPFYIINNNGLINIDTTKKLIASSSCNGPTGSITQIKVTGGETYHWLNTATNAIAGVTIDLLNAAPGNYQLQVSNHYGCSMSSAIITVPPASFNAITVTDKQTRDALCAKDNGEIKIISFDKDATAYSFKWINSVTGTVIGTGTSITNLAAGNYQLLAKDNNNCEQSIYTANIINHPVPTIDYNAVQQKNDDCDQQEAAIDGIKINELVGPTTYTWQNQINTTIGNNINLQNAGAGTYTLTVTDAGICTVQSKPFVISNSDNALVVPVYNNLTIPRYSNANINLKNTATGNYALSLNATGIPVLQQNGTGNFILQAVASDTSVYIQRILGTCTSPFTQVLIKVVDKSFFAVPTAFTPNGDRNNDRLSVKIIGYIDLEYFRIFNRFGVMVFETRRINDGWDGLLNGVSQNPGGYVWIAKGKDLNGNPISAKGSFILIR